MELAVARAEAAKREKAIVLKATIVIMRVVKSWTRRSVVIKIKVIKERIEEDWKC